MLLAVNYRIVVGEGQRWGGSAGAVGSGMRGSCIRRELSGAERWARAGCVGCGLDLAVNKSNYQGRYPGHPHPGRSQFPVPVQSFRSPRRTSQGSRAEGLVAKGGVMWKQGLRAEERYVPWRWMSAPTHPSCAGLAEALRREIP